LIALLHPQHSSFLFKAIGRPDLGVRIPEKHLFCDWLINLPSLVRTYSFDWEELVAFQQVIVNRLSGARAVRVTTGSGSELTFQPRTWRATMGEVFTAPIERSSQGTIFIDGCAYGGRPEKPFLLRIENGRVANLPALDRNDRQQKWVHTDLTRDENSQVLAEFGIGINPGALDTSDMMEAEQARGTCHFGFGNNLAFGGMNASSYHFDLVALAPTIEVDGACIIRSGKLVEV
jgi:leucyl aminopeptidase (aminopeptidase T)